MAFWKSIKKSESAICPICRKTYVNAVSVEYNSKNPIEMCKDCFNRNYKNKSLGRNITTIDSSTNFLTQFRPAPILEKPIFLKRPERKCGWEYSMPHISEYQIIRDTLMWCLMILIINTVIDKNTDFLVSENGMNICLAVAYVIEFICSFFFAIVNFLNLIKGLFLGMGHIRRILLLVSFGITAYLAYAEFYMFLSLFIL